MYINFSILNSSKLTVEQLIVLQICKQNKTEDMSGVLSKYREEVSELFSRDLLTSIKGKSSQNDLQKIRVTKSGMSILSDIETPLVTPDDVRLFEWLCEVYRIEDKLIGNKKKTKLYIAEFRVNSGIEKNELANLLRIYLEDEENMKYNLKLEYAFFKPTNLYQTKFDIEESRLWQYYLKYKEEIDSKYQK